MLQTQSGESNVITVSQAVTASSVLGTVWGNIQPGTMEAGVVSISSIKASTDLLNVIGCYQFYMFIYCS